MVVKATINGLNISEVPTKLLVDGRSRKPHLNTWRDGWRHLRFLLMYSPKWLFLYPGMCLSVIGIAMMTFLTPNLMQKDVEILGANFGASTLTISGAMVIVGIQLSSSGS